MRIILLHLYLFYSMLFFFPICYQLSVNGYNTKSFSEWIKQYSEISVAVYFLLIAAVSHTFLFVLRRKNTIISTTYIEDKVVYSERRILYIAILLFGIGLLADYLYLRVYGGYTAYLVYANAVRSGVISVSNPFSFMIAFRDCIIFSSYLFFSQIRKNGKFQFGIFFFFLASVFFSLRVLYSNSGRLSILIYFIVLIVYIILHKKTISYVGFRTIIWTIVGGIIFFWALIFVGNLLSRNMSTDITTQITKEISFIYVNFIAELKNLKFENWRFFIDTIIFPVYLLPSSIWKVRFGIETASTLNTFLVSGAVKGDSGVYGEMPVDMVSLSYMQLGFIGILFLPIVYALLFSRTIRCANSVRDTNARKMLKFYLIIVGGVESVVYADPEHIMSRIFSFIIFMLFYKMLSMVKIKVGEG